MLFSIKQLKIEVMPFWAVAIDIVVESIWIQLQERMVVTDPSVVCGHCKSQLLATKMNAKNPTTSET